jgi:serpin B
MAPAVSADDVAAQARGNTAFALAVAARAPEGNLFFSPYSISTALAMTYAGARGQTATQMADALHFVLPPDKLHPAFNAIDLALASRAAIKDRDGQSVEAFKFSVANALWGDQRLKIQPSFVDLVGTNYGAGLRTVDFGVPETARATINGWVSDQTSKRIQNLIPEGILTPLTRLVLTNAVYFLAPWETPFSPKATADGPFTKADNSPVTVPMMHRSGHMAYAEGDGWQAAELPYRGGQVVCDVLLPAAGKFAAFEQALTADQLGTMLGALGDHRVNLAMPRFKTTSSLGLNEVLKALGMKDAFDPDKADFSGINGAGSEADRLHISAVLHKAFVKLDEAGTEAAAATAVVMGVRSARGDRPVVMSVDRPFLFLIRDLPTGQILFWGRIVDPSV